MYKLLFLCLLVPSTVLGQTYSYHPVTKTSEQYLAEGWIPYTTAEGHQGWRKPVQPPLVMQACADGSCESGTCSTCGPGLVRRLFSNDWRPAPRRTMPADPDEKPTTPPPAPTPSGIDYDKLTNMIVDRLAADPRIKGPKGDPGPPGPMGPKGDPGVAGKDGVVDESKIVDAVLAKIDYQAIANLVKVNNPAPPIPPPEEERHVVVVADSKASYWPQISSEVKAAQESYYGITIAPTPPFNVGPMPQIVMYENKIPVKRYYGTYEVSTALSKLIRNDMTVWK